MTRASDELVPLRDDPSLAEPELLLGARLLSHAPPLARSELRKRRVWNALSEGRPRRRGLRLTALHVAFASLLVAAVSSAAVGHYYVQHRTPSGDAAVGSTANEAVPARPARAHAHPSKAPGTPLDEPEPSLAPTPPVGEENTAGNNAPSRVPARPKAESTPRKAAPSDADAALLLEAMRARSTGDTARVSELVDQYRARQPQGVLQEEALILSIEAAAARHAPQSAALAREYLQRFPQGRFVAQARRALAAESH